MSLAENRHYAQVKKAKVRRVIKLWHGGWRRDDRAIGRYANHGLQICSCYMCGNPRRYNGGDYRGNGRLTMQERRAQDDLNAAQNLVHAFDREES